MEVAETDRSVVDAPAPAPGTASRLGVLRHRHYRNVWFGALTSNVGGWMEATGIQWVMTTQTLRPEWTERGLPPAPMMLAILAAAQMGPMLILGIPGGLVADRVDRKKLLIVTQFILMATAIALTVLAFVGMLTPWALMTIGAINGVTMAFNIPAWQVLTPRLVPRDELTKAITLNGIAFNMARVVGPGLAGVLMSRTTPGVLFAINSLSFVAVILSVWGTPAAPAPPRDGVRAWDRTKEALSFVVHGKGPLQIFIAMVLFSMLAAPLMRMLPVFAADVYDVNRDVLATYFQLTNADLFGAMLSMMGLGAVVGGVCMRRIPEWYPKHHFIPLSILLGGISIAAWSVLTSFTAAAVAIFFCGAFWLWSFNTSMAAMQMLVDDRMRGRVLAVCNTAVFGAMPLGAVAAGWIGHLFSPHEGVAAQYGVGILAIALVVAGLVMLIWRTPEIDGVKPGESGFERRPGLMRGITAVAHRPRNVDEDNPGHVG